MSLVQATYASFEASNFLIGECIGLGDDRDQVDLGVQASHDLNIQRLQRVASGLNEEDASVDTVVNNVHTIDLVLSVEVCIIATLYVVNNGTPGLIVVDKVPESRGINHGQAETNTSFLDVGADGLNLDSLGNDVVARTLAFSRGVQRSVEKRVDQSRLAKAGLALSSCESANVNKRRHAAADRLLLLTDNHYIKVKALAHTLAVPLVGQVGETDIASQLASYNVLGVLNGRRSCRRRNYRSRVRMMNILRGRGIRLTSNR